MRICNQRARIQTQALRLGCGNFKPCMVHCVICPTLSVFFFSSLYKLKILNNRYVFFPAWTLVLTLVPQVISGNRILKWNLWIGFVILLGLSTMPKLDASNSWHVAASCLIKSPPVIDCDEVPNIVSA